MILIIEDNALEAQLLGIMLRHQILPSGHPIVYALLPDGRQAMQWLAEQPASSVTAVILDRHLKHQEDGLALIPELRASPALALNAAIIIRSIADDPRSISEAKAAQADAFVSKSRRVSTGRLLDVLIQLWQQPEHSARTWTAITI